MTIPCHLVIILWVEIYQYLITIDQSLLNPLSLSQVSNCSNDDDESYLKYILK